MTEISKVEIHCLPKIDLTELKLSSIEENLYRKDNQSIIKDEIIKIITLLPKLNQFEIDSHKLNQVETNFTLKGCVQNNQRLPKNQIQ